VNDEERAPEDGDRDGEATTVTKPEYLCLFILAYLGERVATRQFTIQMGSESIISQMYPRITSNS
jgi:hypothetical protein